MSNNSRSTRWPWLMLVIRSLLFLAWQALIALIYFLIGSSQAWEASAAWWTVTAMLTNLVCIWLLVRLFRDEGLRYWDLFRFQRETIKGDLLVMLLVMVVSAPVAALPNVLLAQSLFGSAEAVMPLFFRPLPLWAILPTLVLFPLTIALAELPTYFGYVMPRLEKQVGLGLGVLLPALGLAFQHVTLPLVFDGGFMLWRLLMFIPFALLVAIVLRWRPRLLPYLVIFHGLMDLYAAWTVLSVSL